MNQAIGRVIRHRHDYGAIILLDERFALQQQQKCLSKWLQPYCYTCKSYGKACAYKSMDDLSVGFSDGCIIPLGEAHIGLTRFFKSNKANAPPPPLPQKSTPQPKSLGLSKRTWSKSLSFSSQDATQNSQVKEVGNFSNPTTAIGDGQSYVNPELFRQHPNNPQRTGANNTPSLAFSSTLPNGTLFVVL